jgi:membrane-associated protease RseP (regulator of RpoE activity)
MIFLISLFICIIIHEFAHFFAAKLVKCRVIEFGIGFGSAIFKFIYKGTCYRFNWILLGGYNKLENGVSYSKKKHAFTNLRYRNKMFITLAGCFANIIIGIASYLIGQYSINHNIFTFGFIIMFFGLFNFALGITNLIPFPALDGSYSILVWLEKIYGKKKGYKLMNKIVNKGMIILNNFNKISIIVVIVLFRVQIIQYLIYYLYDIITILNKITKVMK